MAKCRLAIFLTVFFPIALVYAIPWDAASSTTFDIQSLSTGDPSQSPHPTPAPSVIINGTTYEPPNLCGYVEYSSANSYTCGGNNTCLWNSHLGLVGCGSPFSINYYTSCVPWRHMQDCNASCLIDPRILRCSTPTPYCVTPIIGPHHNYSMFGCEATRVFGRYKVHLTYAGQNTTGHLPRYLGDDDIITYGTRAPKNYTATLTPTTSTALNTNPVGIVVTISVPVTTTYSTQPAWFNGNWSAAGNCSGCHSGRSRWEETQIRTEIIAGTVIGGFMFLLGAGLFLWLFLAWRKLKRTRTTTDEDVEPKDVRLQKLVRDSVLTSEASGSTLPDSQTTSPSRELMSTEREAEEQRVPVSPISEVGSAYMSRGTPTAGVYDDLYDADEDTVPGRLAIPLVVVSEAPDQPSSDAQVDKLYDAEDRGHEGTSVDHMVRSPEDIKEEREETQAEVAAEERRAEPSRTAAECDSPSDEGTGELAPRRSAD